MDLEPRCVEIPPPCVNIAIGILAVRLSISTYDAAALLRGWYPDPIDRYRYCTDLIANRPVRPGG